MHLCRARSLTIDPPAGENTLPGSHDAVGAVTPSANLRKVQGVMDRTSFGTLVFYTCGAFLIVFGVFAAQDNPHARDDPAGGGGRLTLAMRDCHVGTYDVVSCAIVLP